MGAGPPFSDPSQAAVGVVTCARLTGDGCGEQGKPLSATGAPVFEAGERRSTRRSPRYRHSDGPRVGAEEASEHDNGDTGQHGRNFFAGGKGGCVRETPRLSKWVTPYAISLSSASGRIP